MKSFAMQRKPPHKNFRFGIVEQNKILEIEIEN